MNILVVCHYGLYHDLSSSFVHAQAAAYAALGHRVRVLIPVPYGKADRQGRRFSRVLTVSRADGVELYDVRFVSLSNFGERHGWNAAAVKCAVGMCWKRMLEGFVPDVIHAHTLGVDSELGAWLKEKLHCPLVVTTHGSDTSIPVEQGRAAELKPLCDKADRIVAVSSALAGKLAVCGTDTPVSVILNGFRVQALPASSEEKQPCSIIQVGHLIPQKHFDTTLQAFARLQEAYPDAELTVIGQGTEREKLERMAQELGVSKAVHFTGEVSNTEVLSEMSKARFFCMPSVREGFGIVYLEAMVSGCITIGTQGEGIADLIKTGQNGFLVPPEDPDAIAEVVDWCLSHPAEADAVARRGRADALALTWERNAAQYLQLFKELCA